MRKQIKNLLSRIGYNSSPDFMIIGAQKAGTTGLYSILRQHSLILESRKKEVHYFDDDEWYFKKKLHTYHSFFPLPYKVSEENRIFEATPIYLFHPAVARRLYEYNPDLKLIILLRNPVERAFSAWTMYHHHFKTGKFKSNHDPRTFSDAISEELEALDYSGYFDNHRSYVKRGIYYYQIKRYLHYFPANQIMVLESQDLKEKFDESSEMIQSFLDVPIENLRLVKTNKSRVKEKENYKKDFYRLYEFYAPFNKKLSALLDREFSWTV